LWEGGLGARAGDAVRDAERGEEESPPAASVAAQTSFPLAVEKPAGLGELWQRLGLVPEPQLCVGTPRPERMASGHAAGAGLGKAQGHRCLLWHALNGQGVGNWMGHKRDTERGPPQ